MSEAGILELLNEWGELIDESEAVSLYNIGKMPGSFGERIRRVDGQHVIFDGDGHSLQKRLQTKLCLMLPGLKNVICSTPELMDGYQWTRKDFAGLYYEHFRIVIEKLRRHCSHLS